MAKLAIRGHLTRGKEVIETLMMLGGLNLKRLVGTDSDSYYTIANDGTISGFIDAYLSKCSHYVRYTIEEFLEKYPYKVGDKVIIKSTNQEAIIDKVVWCCDTITYWLKYDGCLGGNWRVEHLQPYKETMKEKIQAYEVTEEICANEVAIEFDPSKFEMIERNGKYFVVKKQPKFPKTYKECCDILGIGTMDNDAQGYKGDLIIRFQELLIARDAYWKIGGDWRPTLDIDFIYSIGICYGAIEKRVATGSNGFLLFPTEEMRDAFYENFKELIEQCKELL